MPKISQEKKDKISEQSLFHLYTIFPRQIYTAEIAKEMARDEEFMKLLMLELEKKELVIRVDKNSSGIKYSRRIRWRLSNKAHEAYQAQQGSQQVQPPKTLPSQPAQETPSFEQQ